VHKQWEGSIVAAAAIVIRSVAGCRGAIPRCLLLPQCVKAASQQVLAVKKITVGAPAARVWLQLQG
jgi:hypothetical protein